MFKLIIIPKSARLIKKTAKLEKQFLRTFNTASPIEVSIMAMCVKAFAEHVLSKSGAIHEAELERIEKEVKEKAEADKKEE